MSTTHMVKSSHDRYCVGVGVEYPSIIVRAESAEDLISRFQESVPSYKMALVKYGIEEKPDKILTVNVKPADR